MLAVTTRNKLRSPRFFLPMLRARRLVREQLAAAPGLVRYVSAIAGPTEFLTLTVWEDRQALYTFMSSGAHERFMWMFTRWSSSFWSTRWVPTRSEEGVWEGLSLGSGTCEMDLARAGYRPVFLTQYSATTTSPGRRLIDPGGSGAYAITALVEAHSLARLSELLGGAREVRGNADHTQLLRWSVGAVEPRRFLLVTLWRDEGREHNAPSDEAAGQVCALHRRLGATWTMRWNAGEYEIGHWDHLRLRQLAGSNARHARIGPEHMERVTRGAGQ